jgi:hypothetical protein
MKPTTERFTVTYEIVTPESAEVGDAAERGFISQEQTLRNALADVFQTRTAHCEGVTEIEASCSDVAQSRWATVYNGMEYLTGAHESRSLHFPDNITGASKGRILRLMKA